MDKLITTRWERFWNPEAYARDTWIRREAARLPAGSKVLDAGAGASKYRPLFQHCEYKTQDFCQYQGGLVKYLQPIDYVCDITAIPLPDGSLDAIVCTEVIEHVVDPAAVVKEFARLLKSSGKLFLSAPLLSYLHMEPYHFFGGFTHYWYRHWLPQYGLAIESIEPVGGPGRSAVVFLQTFYSSWSAKEKKTALPLKVLSAPLRLGTKTLVHYLLPAILPRLDPWLGNEVICSAYLVTARRSDTAAPSSTGGA